MILASCGLAFAAKDTVARKGRVLLRAAEELCVVCEARREVTVQEQESQVERRSRFNNTLSPAAKESTRPDVEHLRSSLARTIASTRSALKRSKDEQHDSSNRSSPKRRGREEPVASGSGSNSTPVRAITAIMSTPTRHRRSTTDSERENAGAESHPLADELVDKVQDEEDEQELIERSVAERNASLKGKQKAGSPARNSPGARRGVAFDQPAVTVGGNGTHGTGSTTSASGHRVVIDQHVEMILDSFYGIERAAFTLHIMSEPVHILPHSMHQRGSIDVERLMDILYSRNLLPTLWRDYEVRETPQNLVPLDGTLHKMLDLGLVSITPTAEILLEILSFEEQHYRYRCWVFEDQGVDIGRPAWYLALGDGRSPNAFWLWAKRVDGLYIPTPERVYRPEELLGMPAYDLLVTIPIAVLAALNAMRLIAESWYDDLEHATAELSRPFAYPEAGASYASQATEMYRLLNQLMFFWTVDMPLTAAVEGALTAAAPVPPHGYYGEPTPSSTGATAPVAPGRRSSVLATVNTFLNYFSFGPRRRLSLADMSDTEEDVLEEGGDMSEMDPRHDLSGIDLSAMEVESLGNAPKSQEKVAAWLSNTSTTT